ncbi:hypothetical protein LC653_25670 [Nostoc sp. CHAB 5784]|uniref:hypothetical protein n=1 Tax=Nostoc mirabile TaxID=2907820 RepID=UPI001E590802|nr:hypothetical protein [Nostoc mirabile]MCC5667183.1 hypothetical protein [Nostoc mirabile CHAB5784]
MKEQNELLKQQLIEAISCQNLQEIQKILTLAQLEDETIILKEALVQVEYANFVWFLQEYVGKESYQQAVKDVSTSMTQKLVEGGFKPGVDFNLHPDGRMLASKEANEYLENYQVNSDPTLEINLTGT